MRTIEDLEAIAIVSGERIEIGILDLTTGEVDLLERNGWSYETARCEEDAVMYKQA